MNLSETEINLEKKHLTEVIEEIRSQISIMAQGLYEKEEQQKEFKKFLWDNKRELDTNEMKSFMSDNELEINIMLDKAKHYKLLYKIQNNPYFGRVIFNDGIDKQKIYIGLTYLPKGNDNLIYDWRAPIASLFYDYEIGDAQYTAPIGSIKGKLLNKRQYKIEDGIIKRMFDSNLNIQDDLLQEVLASKTSEKMKNIVNTIQKEQNAIIRNTQDRTLIVQGIAGSGKTSVALHRIAFLLYRIKNLTSNDILIFAPNNVFSEYISNVLPELGEENTKETTFQDFLKTYIDEYKKIESFPRFIERYYKYEEKNIDLVTFKQNDEIIKCIENYAERLTNEAEFQDNIFNHDIWYSKEELNNMLKIKYSKYSLFERINSMAIKIAEQNCNGNKSKVISIRSWLYNILNIKKDFKKIYIDFYKSPEFLNIFKGQVNHNFKNEDLNYEDASPFVYLKGLLNGFWVNNDIQQTIIDEAQDYSKLQYILIKKILKKSNFTILGDTNQTINPYYHYSSLEVLNEIFKENTRYLELLKTYRSSPEIIEHTNKILNLSFVSAIRKENNIPVLFREEKDNLKELLKKDVDKLIKNSTSVAIITKDDEESEKIFKLLKDFYPKITHITSNSKKFNKGLLVMPSYMSKGLEFDATIVYTEKDNKYKENEKYLYYVSCTRSQHQLIIYNQ